MNRDSLWRRLFREHTTSVVLLALCAALSFRTIDEQHPTGAAGGRLLARQVGGTAPRGAAVLIVVRDTGEDAAFATATEEGLKSGGFQIVAVVRGQPADARRAIELALAANQKIDVIAVNDVTGRWAVLENLGQRYPALTQTQIVLPASYWWPNFLKTSNLLNVVNQVADIAIVAIGMTMVIIAGGIDLSVGSLIALAAIAMTIALRDWCGGAAASNSQVVFCAAAAIGACAAAGACSGALITFADIPPFIVTLAMMAIVGGMGSGGGIAFILSGGDTIDQVPPSIDWLGRGADLFGIPNAVVLMLVLYAVADLIMKRTTFGRYLYAVGGNRKAAWLCGVPVKRVVLASYIISAALAGLAGVLQVSLFHCGKPTFGKGYELQVIAAVVVGGTSLVGGEGKLLGTLQGALIIAVVQNGMNLLGIDGRWQPVVLGAVILVAALVDRLKRGKIQD